MGNPVVHFEINSKMPRELHAFYTKLFGWSINDDNPMEYGLVDTNGGTGINGGIGPAQGPSGVVWYVEVPDVDASLQTIAGLGGTTVMPKTHVMEGVTVGVFSDPQGNVVGLVEAAEPQPGMDYGPTKGKGAPVTHAEVLGTDGAALQSFYSSAFGWELQTYEDYGMFGPVDGKGVGGGVGKSQGDPVVTFYVEVPDLQATLDKAASLGGKTVMEPQTVGTEPATVAIAAFRDPEGNLVGLAKSAS